MGTRIVDGYKRSKRSLYDLRSNLVAIEQRPKGEKWRKEVLIDLRAEIKFVKLMEDLR